MPEGDVAVLLHRRKRRGEEIADVGGGEPLEHRARRCVGEMDQGITAQPGVGGRQWIGDDVELLERRGGKATPVGLDQVAHDIAADVAKAFVERDVLDPIVVAAGRIEHGGDIVLLEPRRELLAERVGAGELRAGAALALGAAPPAGLVDLGEDALAIVHDAKVALIDAERHAVAQ